MQTEKLSVIEQEIKSSSNLRLLFALCLWGNDLSSEIVDELNQRYKAGGYILTLKLSFLCLIFSPFSVSFLDICDYLDLDESETRKQLLSCIFFVVLPFLIYFLIFDLNKFLGLMFLFFALTSRIIISIYLFFTRYKLLAPNKQSS